MLRHVRNYSTTHEALKRKVYISNSHDIYTNLALEDCLFNSLTENTQTLLLYQNEPCVVIGKFQNPWLEANVENLIQNGVSLIRRNSGGGTVYHDMGNLNLTFFTTKNDYNRKKNLIFIQDVLRKYYNIPAVINKRDDMVVNDCKVCI